VKKTGGYEAEMSKYSAVLCSLFSCFVLQAVHLYTFSIVLCTQRTLIFRELYCWIWRSRTSCI